MGIQHRRRTEATLDSSATLAGGPVLLVFSELKAEIRHPTATRGPINSSRSTERHLPPTAVTARPFVERHADVQDDDGTCCLAREGPFRLQSTVPVQRISRNHEEVQRQFHRLVLALGLTKFEEKTFKGLVSLGTVKSLTMANDAVHFADTIAKLCVRYAQRDEISSDSLTIEPK